MKRRWAFLVPLLLFSGVLTAAEVCSQLTATGVGMFAPKYPKSGAQGTCENGIYTMLAYGHDYYWAWDRGGFAYLVVRGSADFSFSARMVEADMPDIKSEKVGIVVREGLNGNERAVQLRWDGFFLGSEANAQVSWLYRFMPGTSSSEFCSDANRSSCFQEGGSGVTVANGTTLKISRVSGKYKLFVNDEAVAQDKNIALGGDSVLVGLIGSFGGGDNPSTRTVKFDNITCTGCGSTEAVRPQPAARAGSGWSLARNGSNLTLVTPPGQAERINSISLYNASGKLISRTTLCLSEGNSVLTGAVPNVTTGVLVAAVELVDGHTQVVRCNALK